MPFWTDGFDMNNTLRRLLRNPAGLTGSVLLLVLVVLVVAGPMLAPYVPTQFHMQRRLEGPSLDHWLGTDQFGRDILSRMLAGARSTILFGVISTFIGTAAGTLIGVSSAYFGGRFDTITMRAIDIFLAVPSLLLAMLIVTAMGASTLHALIAVAIAFTPATARIARGVALSERTRDYIQSAVARGEGHVQIIFRELLPNIGAAVVVEGSIRVAFAIMLGATLSFLGMGTQPPASDWGLLAAEARAYMFRNPWVLIAPGVGIAAVAACFNLLGDGLRDALNPKVLQ